MDGATHGLPGAGRRTRRRTRSPARARSPTASAAPPGQALHHAANARVRRRHAGRDARRRGRHRRRRADRPGAPPLPRADTAAPGPAAPAPPRAAARARRRVTDAADTRRPGPPAQRRGARRDPPRRPRARRRRRAPRACRWRRSRPAPASARRRSTGAGRRKEALFAEAIALDRASPRTSPTPAPSAATSTRPAAPRSGAWRPRRSASSRGCMAEAGDDPELLEALDERAPAPAARGDRRDPAPRHRARRAARRPRRRPRHRHAHRAARSPACSTSGGDPTRLAACPMRVYDTLAAGIATARRVG